MLTESQKSVVEAALEHYGDHAQRLKFIEELCECAAAAAKSFANIGCREVASEIADVFITAHCAMMSGKMHDMVMQEIAFKVARLEGRMNGDKKRRDQMEALHG